MKKFIVTSLVVVLLAGFCLLAGSSTAQLYQPPSFNPYNNVATIGGWSTSDLSNPMNWLSSSSSYSSPLNTASLWSTNPVSSWTTSPVSINLSVNIFPYSANLYTSPYSSPSYASPYSPVSPYPFGNPASQLSLGNQFSYNNQLPSLYTPQLSPYPRTSASYSFPQQGSILPGLNFTDIKYSTPRVPRTGKLDYKVETDKAEYELQEPVKITFTVANSDKNAVDIVFSSSQQYDIVIKDSSKAMVWQWSNEKRFAQSFTNRTLEVGKSYSYHTDWDQTDNHHTPVPAGTYTIEASLTAYDKNYAQTVSTQITITESGTAATGILPRFSSCSKLREKLNEITNSSSKDIGYYAAYGMAPEAAALDGTRVAAFSTTASTGGSGADDYSTTNVQVAGVDEADRIKNDGAYIYMIKGRSVRIIKAYPASEMKEYPKIDYEKDTFTPNQLYVDGDTLIVIGNDYEPVQESNSSPIGDVSIMTTAIRAPGYYSPYYIPRSSFTRVIIYDITNRASVKEKRNLKFEGTYLQSRKVDDTLYVVMNQYAQYIPVPVDTNPVLLGAGTSVSPDTPETMIPKYADSARSSNDKADKAICDCEQVSYFPGSTESTYLVVVGIPVDDPDGAIGKEVILGSSQNVYASLDNLFVARTTYTDEDDDGTAAAAASAAPERIVAGYSNSPNTQVYKFSFDEETIQYAGKARVPGTIINQFSMDEYDNHFRIATTKGYTWDESNPSSNNLYVLNGNMEQVGSIENIAPGESIKSVRFMGDKAYVVTFLQVDPLFVVSLADPAHPQILGQLKIPGYSEYLHPYDENHLIGFGRDVDASIDADKIHSANAVYYTAILGMKISLFDVTDVTHPVELHQEIIGYRNTQSELLTDHKALLFSKDKNLMAFPVTVTQKIEDAKDTYSNYEYTFQGAYFYHIDLTSGFEKKAAITHYDSDEEFKKAGYYYYGGENDIRRIIYIGNNFYTISDAKIKAIDMQTYRENNVITLEKSADSDTQPYGYPIEKVILLRGE
ncbi:MAG: beta-propeller domain-containing protein [bacterium]